ncbi:MAG: UvrD-helicase domain-containing protein, partial [Candidatus Riflebacteria bacterium]|nr:UvrD-helicase domain-containing protein [Candidatus Riflebacteria bacterium]
NNLNKAQLNAVKTINGPILCLAGAGSGKTTTLTCRVANLIENNINPSSILLLTFTKKAAKDMLDRVNELIGVKGKAVEGGTFHSFASKIISKFGDRLNINRNFTVIDDNDSADIIQSLRDQKLDCFQDYNVRMNKKLIFQIISKSRNCSQNLKETLELYYSSYRINEIGLEYINKTYTNYKKTNNLLDYDDLLEYLYRLLLIPDIQQILSDQYKYIMVDEYQDTNSIQALITNLLAEKHQNIMVVGDDAQSIYSFRGSRIENILNFNKQFPTCKIIKLEENYRSYKNILNGCNSLIDKSLKCIKKNLYTDKPDGNKIILVKCISEKEEAVLVAHRILQLYNLGYSLNDMAVLFRNSNYSYELELELARRGIPYKKTGGKKIFESEHIRNIISYLRLLNSPFDKISWLRVLMLIKGIGINTATGIYEFITKQPEPYDLSNYKIKSTIKNQLKKLSELMLKLVKNIDKNPAFLLNFIFDYYLSVLKNENNPDISKIIKDLDQISIISEKYDKLQDFLSELYIDKTEEDDKDKSEKMMVTLSTIHSAKGLEWKQVFLISAVEGRLPSLSSISNPDELEEERRLTYVAMTRAMEGLLISYPSDIWDQSHRELLTKPSRFITDISPDYLEVWNIRH